MMDIVRSALEAVRFFCRMQRELALENLALRHPRSSVGTATGEG